MKYKYLITAFVLLGFAGCNDDEHQGKEDPGTKAEIRALPEGSTNPEDALAWDLKTIIGVNTLDENSINIKYQYWGDESGIFEVVNGMGIDNTIYLKGTTETTLTAYYPYTGSVAADPNPIRVVTTEEQQADQVAINYMFATATGSENDPVVDFAFTRRLSKVIFLFKADGIDLDDITYKLSGLAMDGTFNTLTGVAEAGTSFTSVRDITMSVTLPENGSDMTSVLLVLPQQEMNVSMEVEMKNKHYTSLAQTMTLETGYEYIYTVTVVAGTQHESPVLTLELLEGRPWENDGTYPLTASPLDPDSLGESTMGISQWEQDTDKGEEITSTPQ